jgi:hypothetical protein
MPQEPSTSSPIEEAEAAIFELLRHFHQNEIPGESGVIPITEDLAKAIVGVLMDSNRLGALIEANASIESLENKVEGISSELKNLLTEFGACIDDYKNRIREHVACAENTIAEIAVHLGSNDSSRHLVNPVTALLTWGLKPILDLKRSPWQD